MGAPANACCRCCWPAYQSSVLWLAAAVELCWALQMLCTLSQSGQWPSTPLAGCSWPEGTTRLSGSGTCTPASCCTAGQHSTFISASCADMPGISCPAVKQKGIACKLGLPLKAAFTVWVGWGRACLCVLCWAATSRGLVAVSRGLVPVQDATKEGQCGGVLAGWCLRLLRRQVRGRACGGCQRRWGRGSLVRRPHR